MALECACYGAGVHSIWRLIVHGAAFIHERVCDVDPDFMRVNCSGTIEFKDVRDVDLQDNRVRSGACTCYAYRPVNAPWAPNDNIDLCHLYSWYGQKSYF